MRLRSQGAFSATAIEKLSSPWHQEHEPHLRKFTPRGNMGTSSLYTAILYDMALQKHALCTVGTNNEQTHFKPTRSMPPWRRAAPPAPRPRQRHSRSTSASWKSSPPPPSRSTACHCDPRRAARHTVDADPASHLATRGRRTWPCP